MNQRRHKYGLRGAVALAALLALAVPAVAQAPQPVSGSNVPERRKVAGPVFQFQSGFWLNLHHFLYQQARLRSERPVTRTGTGAAKARASAPDGASLVAATEGLRPEELAAWNRALEFYESDLAKRDLLFDNYMVLMKNRLAELAAAPDLSTSGLRKEVVEAMEAAAPVYRAHWWAAHDGANREWVQKLEPMVEKLGTKLAQELSNVYQADWPQEPVVVDVSVYAGRVAGYTSLDPVHVTVSSVDPRNQDEAALEILFHEASHGLARAVAEGIARECRLRKKPIPRDLWHAVLFYTTGEVVRRTLSAQQSTEYMPYAYRHGLYERGWQNFQPLLERHWQLYLDGKIDFDRAIARMANAL
jgi:hypothetical protein